MNVLFLFMYVLSVIFLYIGGSQNSSCTQPEIVTVENGVAVSDVSPGHGISTSSQSSEIAMQEMAESNNYLEDRFSRVWFNLSL